MRLIKLALLSFIILFLLVTVISLFIPSEIRISKATNVAADDKIIFSYIEQLPDWRKWHPAIKELSDSSFHILNDSSIRVHNTTITVVERKQDEVVTEMAIVSGRPVISGFKLIRHQPADSATLQWYMDFKLRWYPWEKFKSLFYENIYGMQMEQGLTNLKELSNARRS